MAETPQSEDIAENTRLYAEALKVGTQEFAGHVVTRIDKLMADGLSLRDQEILYGLRKQIFEEIGRRFPDFDLEQQSLRHR